MQITGNMINWALLMHDLGILAWIMFTLTFAVMLIVMLKDNRKPAKRRSRRKLIMHDDWVEWVT